MQSGTESLGRVSFGGTALVLFDGTADWLNVLLPFSMEFESLPSSSCLLLGGDAAGDDDNLLVHRDRSEVLCYHTRQMKEPSPEQSVLWSLTSVCLSTGFDSSVYFEHTQTCLHAHNSAMGDLYSFSHRDINTCDLDRTGGETVTY